MSLNAQAAHETSPELVVTFVRRVIEEHRIPQRTDRRNHPRKAISVPVIVEPLDEAFSPAAECFSAVTKNISTGGIGILHTEFVNSHYLRIGLSTAGETMQLLAQVKNCVKSGEMYHIGARFVVDWRNWRSKQRANSRQLTDLSNESRKVR